MKIVTNWSNGKLVAEAESFACRYPEVLFVGPAYSPTVAGGLSASVSPVGSAGVHRVSFLQMARQLAQPALAEFGLAPVSTLGVEALASRVAFLARQQDALVYFKPVANLPGFSRALARTLRELRLAGVSSTQLSKGSPPARDLSVLLEDYEEELSDRSLADLAILLELATEAANTGRHRWAGLPVVVLDADVPTRAHRDLLEAIT
ncbi:MAG: hypothetical protein ABI995_12030, partial [Acidobacteriota bacterium]